MVSRCLCNSTILVSNNMAVIFLESVTRILLLRLDGVLTKPSNRPKLYAFLCCCCCFVVASSISGCCCDVTMPPLDIDFTMTGVNVLLVAAIRLAMPLLTSGVIVVIDVDDAVCLRCTNGTRMRGFVKSDGL